MTDDEATELMRSAWATRRASLDAAPDEKSELLTQAWHELERATELCRVQGAIVPLAQAVHLSANVAVDLGDVDRAGALWDEAVALLRTVEEPLQLAHKVRHLGDLHRRCGRPGDAETCYREALSLYRAHDAPGSLDFANAVSRMAGLKEARGASSEALALWRETRDLYVAVDLADGVAEAERHIAHLAD
jgi:tetratricopeptide (TPR) repeat protein